MARMQFTRAESALVADELNGLKAENASLRSALAQFVAACETAPPTSLMVEIGTACKLAKEALAARASHRLAQKGE